MAHRYLTFVETQELTRLSATWIRVLRRRKEFPEPIRLSRAPNGRLRWKESEILEWLERQREAA